MRFRDRSSDVCSSELLAGAALRKPRHAVVGRLYAHHLCHRLARRRLRRGAADLGADALVARGGQFLDGDRMSGVWGRSVSVRVDLGGGQIIKKKATECAYGQWRW